MDPRVNERQLEVLQWVADGCPDGKWSDGDFTYKLTANALKSRRLVKIRKGTAVEKRWECTITEAGRHYLEHGDYPPGHVWSRVTMKPVHEEPKPRGRPARPKQQTAPAVGTSAPAPVHEPEELRLPKPGPKTQLPSATRHEPAMRPILDNPKWLRLSPELRKRALRVAGAIVKEARAAGWKVSLADRRPLDWLADNPQFYSKYNKVPSLLVINPGHMDVEIAIRTVGYAPPKDAQLRFVVRGVYDAIVEDTRLTFVEDKLDRLMSLLAGASLANQRGEAMREIRRIEREQQEAQRQERLGEVRHYTKWRDNLLEAKDRWQEHRELRQFIEEFEQATQPPRFASHRAELDAYIAWARQMVEESDPINSVYLPEGDVPTISYKEWKEAARSMPRY